MLATTGRWQDVVYGLIIILAAIFMPTGLLGLVQSLYQKLRGRSRTAAPAEPPAEEAVEERAMLQALSGESKEGVR